MFIAFVFFQVWKPDFSFSISKIFTAKTTSFEHRSTNSILFTMEKLLAIIEPTAQSDEVEIDPEKLKILIPRSKFGILVKFLRPSSSASRLTINLVF